MSKTNEIVYSQLEYESLRDEAWNMAHTLQDIEKEVKLCARCGGREDCGYSATDLLKELCYIFSRDIDYHNNEKYSIKKKENRQMIDIDKMNKLDEDGLFITDKHVFFYGSALSNFQITSFLYTDFGETHRFFTSEQAFMWVKAKYFKDEETASEILKENFDPMACKKLGRKVKNYDEEVWDKVRYDVFFKVNYEKFTQDEKMTKFILQDKFEGKTFVEASPYDGIWGVRIPISDPAIADEKNWRGKNLLGKCLTEVRAAVKSNKKVTDNETIK